MQKDDKELELPDSWKMTALQGILCGEIQRNVEYRQKEFRTYEELRSTVMRWAINKKIEWPNEEIEDQTEDIDYASPKGKGKRQRQRQSALLQLRTTRSSSI